MHKFKIKKAFVKNNVHKHFLSIQVVNDWDSLSPVVGNAVSLDRFKIKLDKILSDKKYDF